MLDTLGDRMKMYEGIEADRFLMPGLPICARLDGRSFHNFTRGLKRPYDERLSKLMIETTKALVEETKANIGYTQSDEISLVWIAPNVKSETFFAGRIQKLCSVLASIATGAFNANKIELLPEKKSIATFDCRAWNVPNIDEAVNSLRWREWDATKNSITMAASSMYSHKELQGKNGSVKQEMMFTKGVNFNDYPAFFKRGTYVQRKNFTRPFNSDEMKRLPPQHEAHRNPGLLVTRSQVVELDMKPIGQITNINDVIMFGVDPI